jgi:C4-dicarboxylate-specific signal transduction histidine kinase
VFAGISPETYASLPPLPNMTGILFDTQQHFRNTLALAESLQPDARRLFVIAGSGSLDRRWQATARRVVESQPRKFVPIYLYELSYDALLEELARVPKDSIVVPLTFFEDATGKFFASVDVVTEIFKRSPAPTYSPYFAAIGLGAVGASSESYESMGAAAADMTLQILTGKDPSAIPVQANPEPSYQVDYRTMQRWGLSERNLPTKTTVLFKEPSVWDQHRNFVLATILVVALQSMLVAILLMQRRRRLRTETLLRESEERMTLAAAAVNVGLWQYNAGTGELWATEHCRAIFHLDPGILVTREAFLKAIHPEDRDVAIASLRHAAGDIRPAISDVRVVWPDEQVRWVRIRTRAHADRPDAPARLTGTIVDITEQKSAEIEAAMRRQEVAHLMRVSVLGQLSGAIAHEINQPLAAILANAQAALQLLSESPANADEVREALADIVQDDNRASQVIQRLRSLLKKGEATTERIFVNDLVKATLALLNSELVGRRVGVQLALANGLPPALGDPVQLQQVLINLIVNAMDAMASTPATRRQITIATCVATSGAIEVSVKDRGTGIVPEAKDKVFEPFQTTKEHGLGLGLPICSTIIQAHGGNLSLTNNADGGAEARFSLPIHETLMAAAQ